MLNKEGLQHQEGELEVNEWPFEEDRVFELARKWRSKTTSYTKPTSVWALDQTSQWNLVQIDQQKVVGSKVKGNLTFQDGPIKKQQELCFMFGKMKLVFRSCKMGNYLQNVNHLKGSVCVKE